MAQGKMKVKTKVPESNKNKKGKGKAVTQRANKPITPKKHKFEEAHKLKKAITKTVNKAVEKEMRDRSSSGQKNFSKAQEAVAAHHKKLTQAGASTSS
ncbi:uncharacterized protein [Atheta coriaria]|uniref:uncharacterized protein n=1 Tax=Dalotia coriaria TaxID=877792 RepID=UPI0031F457B1